MAVASDAIMELALKRCFLAQSNEIYGGVAGFYDYGPAGCALKRRIEALWRRFFVSQEGFYEIETPTTTPEIVLKASGHVDNFVDPLVGCSNCKRTFRADHLVAAQAGVNAEGMNVAQLHEAIRKHGVKCPDCKGALGEPTWFKLMLRTNIGAAEGNTAYMRPETAQGIFVDFPRVFRCCGSKLPLGIAQVGKSYRNEISPRQGLLRLREFTQMELEYFFNPADARYPNFDSLAGAKIRFLTHAEQRKENGEVAELTPRELVEKKLAPNEIMAYFIAKESLFYQMCGVPYERFRFRHMLPEETPHYSGGNVDLEVKTSFGWIETVGNAYRTDYDLKAHAKTSGKDLSVLDSETNAKVLAHVVEPSFGTDRLFWCVLESCYREAGAKEWAWLDFPPAIAPFDAAVLPLMKRDGMPEKARSIAQALRAEGFSVIYDESGSVGKRYARADELGVPYAITVDYDTLKDGTATIRFRNDGKQLRESVAALPQRLAGFIKSGAVTCP